jgi:hypothetical protein
MELKTGLTILSQILFEQKESIPSLLVALIPNDHLTDNKERQCLSSSLHVFHILVDSCSVDQKNDVPPTVSVFRGFLDFPKFLFYSIAKEQWQKTSPSFRQFETRNIPHKCPAILTYKPKRTGMLLVRRKYNLLSIT